MPGVGHHGHQFLVVVDLVEAVEGDALVSGDAAGERARAVWPKVQRMAARLYATALSGAFLANYKDDGDVIFDQISGVYRQDTPAMMYVTAGNRLYYFSLP